MISQSFSVTTNVEPLSCTISDDTLGEYNKQILYIKHMIYVEVEFSLAHIHLHKVNGMDMSHP